jgi:hypothetical protein
MRWARKVAGFGGFYCAAGALVLVAELQSVKRIRRLFWGRWGGTMGGTIEGADITVLKPCAEGIALRKSSQGLQMGLYNYRTNPTSGRF